MAMKNTIDDKESRKPNILLCCSGSVASVKVPELAHRLSLLSANVLVVASNAALHFINRAKEYDPLAWQNFEQLGGRQLILSDNMEWSLWNNIGDTVLHIELKRWADIVVLSPASANTLAKMAAGICDSLLLAFLRAMDGNCSKILCPAMNTNMYEHPFTDTHLQSLQMLGWKVVAPVVKELACGDKGAGALAPVEYIVRAVEDEVGLWKSRPRTIQREKEKEASIQKMIHIFDNNIVSMDKSDSMTAELDQNYHRLFISLLILAVAVMVAASQHPIHEHD